MYIYWLLMYNVVKIWNSCNRPLFSLPPFCTSKVRPSRHNQHGTASPLSVVFESLFFLCLTVNTNKALYLVLVSAVFSPFQVLPSSSSSTEFPLKKRQIAKILSFDIFNYSTSPLLSLSRSGIFSILRIWRVFFGNPVAQPLQ